MHVILWLWLCQDVILTQEFIDFEQYFKFIEQDVLNWIYKLWWVDEKVPNLTHLFVKCTDSLENKYKVKLNKSGKDFLFDSKNFTKIENETMNRAKDLFEPLMHFDENSIVDKDKLIELEHEYQYKIGKHGIKLSAPSLFKLAFKAFKNDSDATNDIVTIVSPLLRDIPGGISLYKIMINLSKNNLDKIINIMPTLVRVMLLTEFNFDLNLSDEDIKMKIDQLKFTKTLIDGVTTCLNSVLLLISK